MNKDNNKSTRNNLILSVVLAIFIIMAGFFAFHNFKSGKNNLATSNMPNVVRNDLANVESASQNNPLNPPSQNITPNPSYIKRGVADASDPALETPTQGRGADQSVGFENSTKSASLIGGDPLVKGGFKVKGGGRTGYIDDSLPANAAIAYVREDCTGYSPCYNTLNDWETAFGGISFAGCTSGDLTCATLNKSAIAIIDGNWTSPDTEAVTISGWVTGPNNYIKIYTTAAARHNGKWNTGKYRLVVSNASAITIDEAYVFIDGLQVQVDSANANLQNPFSFQTGANNPTYVSNCILRGHGNATYSQYGIAATFVGQNTYVWNCIVYGISTNASSRNLVVGGGTGTFYNVTTIGGTYGFRQSGGTMTVKNSYAGDSSTGDFDGTISQTTNASADTTAVGTSLDSIPVNTTNFTNVTADSEDFHLPVGSALIDVGTDTSGESAPLNFTTDIDGQSRDGTWDIGADAFGVVSPGVKFR